MIIGPNGAGKTTLFNLITGDLERDSGSIRLFGDEVSRLKPHQRAHRGLARTYQIITLFPKDSLQHNIVLSLLGLRRMRWGTFKALARYTELDQEAREVLKRVGLEHLSRRPIAEVAYGEKRRLEIAMALAQKPRLLLLDEPLAGLSREERSAMKDLMTVVRHDPVAALRLSLARTWETSVFSLKILGKMVVGEVSWKNLSGPVTIADYAGQSVKLGLAYYLGFLAVVSVSLGVLNLLPLPMLDGGHLMYYLFEGVTGRPVSEAWLKWLQRGGALIMLLLMTLALSNDVARLLGLH